MALLKLTVEVPADDKAPALGLKLPDTPTVPESVVVLLVTAVSASQVL